MTACASLGRSVLEGRLFILSDHSFWHPSAPALPSSSRLPALAHELPREARSRTKCQAMAPRPVTDHKNIDSKSKGACALVVAVPCPSRHRYRRATAAAIDRGARNADAGPR
jgi:hypothetical protein